MPLEERRLAGADSAPMTPGDWVQQFDDSIALRLPIATLPVGAYKLEVRVTHSDEQDTVVRTAEFDVR